MSGFPIGFLDTMAGSRKESCNLTSSESLSSSVLYSKTESLNLPKAMRFLLLSSGAGSSLYLFRNRSKNFPSCQALRA